MCLDSGLREFRYQVVVVVQPETLEQLIAESWLHGVGDPLQVVVPDDQEHGYMQEALVVFALHGVGVPRQALELFQ